MKLVIRVAKSSCSDLSSGQYLNPASSMQALSSGPIWFWILTASLSPRMPFRSSRAARRSYSSVLVDAEVSWAPGRPQADTAKATNKANKRNRNMRPISNTIPGEVRAIKKKGRRICLAQHMLAQEPSDALPDKRLTGPRHRQCIGGTLSAPAQEEK